MFHVQKPEMINKTIRMPQELVRQMEVLAQKKGISLNNLIVQCCRYAMNDLPPEESKKSARKKENL